MGPPAAALGPDEVSSGLQSSCIQLCAVHSQLSRGRWQGALVALPAALSVEATVETAVMAGELAKVAEMDRVEATPAHTERCTANLARYYTLYHSGIRDRERGLHNGQSTGVRGNNAATTTAELRRLHTGLPLLLPGLPLTSLQRGRCAHCLCCSTEHRACAQ